MPKLYFETIDLISLILFLIVIFYPTVENNTTLFQKIIIKRGKGQVVQYIFFEIKPLASFYLFHWDSSEEIDQDRFHSHAFNSICLRIAGSYTEDVLNGNKVTTAINPFIRFLPRNHIHRIVKAEPSSYSLVLTGPWNKDWWEFDLATNLWVKYGFGRRALKEQNEYPLELK